MLNVKNKVFSHCALGGLYPICNIEVAIYISNKNNVDRARTILYYIKELPYREKKKQYKRKLQNV